MLRAEPSMVRMAASTVAALRSGIFCWAISFTWARVTLPTLSLLGTPEPLIMPAAFLRSSAAGGVLVINANDLSENTVIMTGTTVSPIFWVWALNVLQNSMMLTPCWPRAGPTGGAGLAFPAGTCSFTWAVTFLVMRLVMRRQG